MKSYTTAALLGLLLTVGCADNGNRDSQKEDQQTPAATEPAPSATSPSTPRDEQQPPAAMEEAPESERPAAPSRTNRPAARSNAARPDAASRPTAPDRATPRETTPAPARQEAEWREVTVPQGTALPLELETALSSETATVETPVRARLKQAVVVNGVTAIPAGAVLTGEVTDVARAGKVKGRSRLAFTFNRMQAGNVREDVKTNSLSYTGEASKGEDATKVGAGAVGGAIIGGILGGGSGAAKGAAIGGAAGSGVVLATRGKEVELASGADLAASLAEPLTIRIQLR